MAYAASCTLSVIFLAIRFFQGMYGSMRNIAIRRRILPLDWIVISFAKRSANFWLSSTPGRLPLS
ncbi:hypothetical protein [Streptomyces sp. V1I1]|uniref:hypothetical protein n=1 Tax=Streptomyces sp. V1I1 TaxID=3042272 RepID=UPI002781E3DB|nr:hypothetical protein [Streptomyces sp. V1I1]MDQ0942691.1 hypothetical protein [Streptomyces sp. V1I1]